MTFSKKTEFPERLQQISSAARALAHPARLEILDYLAQHGRTVSGELAGKIPLSPATVSQHLNLLLSVGLIRGQNFGKNVNYWIEKKRVLEMEEMLHHYLWKVAAFTVSGDKEIQV